MKRNKALLKFPLFVAGRQLLSRREPAFAFFLTMVATLGVAVGISALIVVISVMSGFSGDVRSKLMGFSPHITVSLPKAGLSGAIKKIGENFGGISEIGPFATGEIVVQPVGGGDQFSAAGAKVLGIARPSRNFLKTASVYWGGGLYGDIWWHKYLPPLSRGVIMGSEMMYQLGVLPDVGDSVQLIAPFGGIDPLGNPAPVRREYDLVGGFRSGFFEYDVKYVLLSFDEAARLLADQGRYGIEINLERPGQAERYIKDLRKFFGGGYKIEGWADKNRRLFAALKLEKVAMTFLLFLIIVIASFSIVGVTLMTFYSKRRDLAVLMAIGAPRHLIEWIFLSHGALIGFAGALLGTLAGLGGCFAIARSNIMLPPSYYLDYLPVSVSPLTVVLIAIGGMLISMAASYYPARRASRLEPVELLRYE